MAGQCRTAFLNITGIFWDNQCLIKSIDVGAPSTMLTWEGCRSKTDRYKKKKHFNKYSV